MQLFDIVQRLAVYQAQELSPQNAKRAAVLVPLRQNGERIELILTRRTEALGAHSGQVAFPGGRVETKDIDSIETALRETEEELGLKRSNINIIGQLDQILTGTGFHIQPVVGIVAPDATWIPDSREVARVFTAPLQIFLNEGAWLQSKHQRQGKEITLWHISHDGEEVWGATAAIIRMFLRVLGLL